GREDDDDREGNRRAVHDLQVLAELVEEDGRQHYFVPYRRSPASPRPGTMKPRSFSPRSIAAQTMCTSGCSRWRRSIPSGAATSDTRATDRAPASFTTAT